MEVWKPIPNTGNRYYISNYGRVKSLCGKTERIMKQRNHRIKRVCGDVFYKSVGISFGHCNIKHFLVHRLVAEAFVENPNGYPIVNHKDENPANNNADNLEWCTYSYNSRYGEAQTRRNGSRKVRRVV